MRPRRLMWHLYPSHLLVALVALLAVTWYFSRVLHDFYLQQQAAGLRAIARVAAVQASEPLASGGRLDPLAERLGREAGVRITLILPSGRVVGDSADDPERMANHADRSEVAAALAGEAGTAVRFSQTLQQRMMYVAVPVGTPPGGVLRVALPLTEIDATLNRLYGRVAFGAVAVAMLAALISFAASRRLSRPLEEMRRGAERFAEGDLSSRLAGGGTEEIDALAEAMNRMAGQLDERMHTVLRQHNEQEAVLASMVEGVLAVDKEERLLRLNRAAADLLEVEPETAQGRRIQEAIRKADLQRFVARALASRAPVEGDIVLRGPEEELFLQAHGTPLRDAEGKKIGALIVLHDVTRLHRLERVRRDFVANVSHELKTPITAIKGFVETLRDGAIEDLEAARRFLDIITRQADRLNAIIEDLLSLSRIEQSAERREIPLHQSPLQEVLRSAVQATAIQAAAREVRVEFACPPELQARINPPLLEQAVVNLVDNAVKYSEPRGCVRVEAAQEEGEVRIRVRDWGCGIGREHLPRLFERFYRVDKARSRKQGGTGLGLAIVKHIVQAHGGQVSVQSVPGEGSLFTIRLPEKNG